MTTPTQDRTVTIGGYAFDEGEHCHTLDGVPLHGVTTVLSVIAKPALIQWAAGMAADHASACIESGKAYTEDELAAIFKEAKVAHRKKKEAAGDVGSEIHHAVEQWIATGEVKKYHNEIVEKALNNFIAWATENKVKFIESEKHVHSKKLWVGGILDLVFEMDGKKYIGDIKTSSGIYNEAFFQMGAYHLCLEDMGEAEGIEGYIVINLKKDGKMDLKMADQLEINKQAFLSALSLYKIINSVK
jgi:CRISPR/Cas system-associated exonuclease Cas4 (RecB family)